MTEEASKQGGHRERDPKSRNPQRKWQMKSSPKNPPSKEVYRLWYEYLKESPDFIQACKKALENEKHMGERAAWFWGPGIPGGGAWPEAEMGYGVYAFGNIHVLDFEEWWEIKKKQLAEYDKRKKNPIEDYARSAGQVVFGIIGEFKRLTGREPDLDEFLAHYRNHLASFDHAFLYLRINLRNAQNLELLKKAFGKIVNQKKKDPIIKRNLQFGERWIYPSHPIRQDELERYLKVLKAFKQDLSWKQIAASEQFYHGRGFEDPRKDPKYRGKLDYTDSVKAAIFADRKNAKRIIKNPERGLFPGPYSRISMK